MQVAENILGKYNLEWKSLNTHNSPETDGYVAGINEAGNKVYIGRVQHHIQLCIGKLLMTASPGFQSGLYIEYNSAEHIYTVGIEYYAIEDTCSYQWVPSSKGLVSNAIQFYSDKYTMYIGRVNNFNEVQVGKVALPLGLFYTHRGQIFSGVGTYEVLTCKRIPAPAPDSTPAPTPASRRRTTTKFPDESSEVDELEAEIRKLKKIIAKMTRLQTDHEDELESKVTEISELREKLKRRTTTESPDNSDKSCEVDELEAEIGKLKKINEKMKAAHGEELEAKLNEISDSQDKLDKCNAQKLY